MNKRLIPSVNFFTGILFTLTAAPGQGVPFQSLQGQVNEIADAISESDKVVAVDCVNVSIGDALANAAPGGRLIINVNGTACTENVTVTRNDVTVEGNSGTGEDGSRYSVRE